eukprot:212160_1
MADVVAYNETIQRIIAMPIPTDRKALLTWRTWFDQEHPRDPNLQMKWKAYGRTASLMEEFKRVQAALGMSTKTVSQSGAVRRSSESNDCLDNDLCYTCIAQYSNVDHFHILVNGNCVYTGVNSQQNHDAFIRGQEENANAFMIEKGWDVKLKNLKKKSGKFKCFVCAADDLTYGRPRRVDLFAHIMFKHCGRVAIKCVPCSFTDRKPKQLYTIKDLAVHCAYDWHQANVYTYYEKNRIQGLKLAKKVECVCKKLRSKRKREKQKQNTAPPKKKKRLNDVPMRSSSPKRHRRLMTNEREREHKHKYHTRSRRKSYESLMVRHNLKSEREEVTHLNQNKKNNHSRKPNKKTRIEYKEDVAEPDGSTDVLQCDEAVKETQREKDGVKEDDLLARNELKSIVSCDIATDKGKVRVDGENVMRLNQNTKKKKKNRNSERKRCSEMHFNGGLTESNDKPPPQESVKKMRMGKVNKMRLFELRRIQQFTAVKNGEAFNSLQQLTAAPFFGAAGAQNLGAHAPGGNNRNYFLSLDFGAGTVVNFN